MAADRRQRLLLVAAIVCLTALAGDRFVVAPLARLWNARSARITELNASLAKGELLVDRAESVRGRWGEMKQASLPKELPAAESLTLAAVSKWAGESGLSITSLKPRWRLEEKEFKALECRVTANGSLGAIVRFLYGLETDLLPLRIEDVEVSTRDPKGSQLTLAIRFSGFMLAEGES